MRTTGRVWTFGHEINTDLIIPGHAMFLADEQRRRCLFQSHRPGWVDQVQAGDIIVAGRSFGMGSSRPASLVLKQAGIACVLAESVGRLFFRNSVSFGLLTLECPGILGLLGEGETIEVSTDDFVVRNPVTGAALGAKPVPPNLMELMQGGGIYPLLESQGLIAPYRK